MACGLAVVGSEQSQLRKLLTEFGQTDLLIPNSDPQALAAVLLNLLENRDRLKHHGREGRRLVVEKYNWERTVRDTLYEIQAYL